MIISTQTCLIVQEKGLTGSEKNNVTNVGTL